MRSCRWDETYRNLEKLVREGVYNYFLKCQHLVNSVYISTPSQDEIHLRGILILSYSNLSKKYALAVDAWFYIFFVFFFLIYLLSTETCKNN